MDPKFLSENGWKAVSLKFKVKDNGLQKALANYEDTDEQDLDGRLKCVATVSQLAGALKKGKDGPRAPEVAKYLANVTSAAEADVIAHCKRLIASYKCPKRVEVVAELPRTATGKLNKLALREAARALQREKE